MEPFIGQIMMFGGSFAPRGWAFCEGQLLPISQNAALFSILGTTYGGDGRSTFALPDLRGRVAIHPGSGPGLSNYRLGEKGGVESVTLNVNQIPAHSHGISASNGAADSADPTASSGFGSTGRSNFYMTDAQPTAMKSGTVSSVGGNQAHTNIQPFTAVNFIIALQGVFPSRS
jgi:microcystin-dependent protein